MERLCDDTDLAERKLLGSVLDLVPVGAKVPMRGRAAKLLTHTTRAVLFCFVASAHYYSKILFINE